MFIYDFSVTISITNTAIQDSDKTLFSIEIMSIIATDSVGSFCRSMCVLNCHPSNTSNVKCVKSPYITLDGSLDTHMLQFFITDVYTAVTHNVFVENLT